MVKRVRGALTQKKALEIITAACEPLRGRVQLASTGEETCEFAIFHSYDWIDILVPDPMTMRDPVIRHTLGWVDEAREACVMIRLLSCCDGFGADENPQFWKRVFDNLAGPRSSYQRPSVDDAHGFFKDVSFPRFRLTIGDSEIYEDFSWFFGPSDPDDEAVESISDWFKRVIQVFCGLDDDEDYGAPQSSSTIRGYANELLDHVDMVRYLRRSVDIGLHLQDVYDLYELSIAIYNLQIDFDELNTKKASMIPIYRGHFVFPRARFTTLSFKNPQCFDDESEVADLTKILDDCAIVIPQLEFYVSDNIGDCTWENFLFSALQMDEPRIGSVGVLSLGFDSASRWKVKATFSALPHATNSVHTVRIRSSESSSRFTLKRREWAWLSFALLDPRTAESSWKYLDLSGVDPSESSARALKSPAHASEEMCRVLFGEQRPVRFGFVTLFDDTECYYSELLEGDTMYTTEGELVVFAIVHETRLEDEREAVCVIVPGFGHGWVSIEQAYGFEECRLSKAPLQGLRYGSFLATRQFDILSLQTLSSDIGHLDLSNVLGPLSSSELLRITQSFSKLRNLRCRHRPDVFQSFSALAASSITGLHLEVASGFPIHPAPSDGSWRCFLGKLEELRIATYVSETRNRRAMREIVSKAYAVERFMWTCPISKHPQSYDEGRKLTRQRLNIAKGRNDTAQGPLDSGGKLAFLSVVSTKNIANSPSSARSLVSQDAILIIFQFATSKKDRQVWCETSC